MVDIHSITARTRALFKRIVHLAIRRRLKKEDEEDDLLTPPSFRMDELNVLIYKLAPIRQIFRNKLCPTVRYVSHPFHNYPKPLLILAASTDCVIVLNTDFIQKMNNTTFSHQKILKSNDLFGNLCLVALNNLRYPLAKPESFVSELLSRSLYFSLEPIDQGSPTSTNSISFELTTPADTVEILVHGIWQTRFNTELSGRRLTQLGNYILTNVNRSFQLVDYSLFLPLLRATAANRHSVQYATKVLNICKTILYFDSMRDCRHIRAMTGAFFIVDVWSDLNVWLQQGISTGSSNIIHALCKLFIYLSKNREVRLQKLPQPVLDFLFRRTELLLESIPKFMKDPLTIKLVLTHLSLMVGTHSECRWKLRQIDGLSTVMSVLPAYPKNRSIQLFCCKILSYVAEGFLKRKIRIFHKRECTYLRIVRCLQLFIQCNELVTSIMNFLRKVLELCREDVEFLRLADARPVLELAGSEYKHDPTINNLCHQVLDLYDKADAKCPPRRAKSKAVRKCRDVHHHSHHVQKGNSKKTFYKKRNPEDS